MEKIFSETGVVLTSEQMEKFEKYYGILNEYNSKFNLTAIEKKEDVYIKHFEDSLLGLELLKSGNLLDVGSGAGFPGVPLKIMREDIPVTLLEATAKKCGFLEILKGELGLKGVTVLNGRAEDLAHKAEFRERFENCVSRAVARLNALCEYCLPFLKPGGVFLAYKANAEEELKESLSAIKLLGGEVKEVHEFSLFGAKREIIEIVKIRHTGSIYPRANGKIRKCPL